MFDIEVDPYFIRMINIFHLLFASDEGTVCRKFAQKVLLVIFIFCFPITIFIGALQNENKIEALYLTTLGVLTIIFSMKAYYAYSKKNDIIHILNMTCVHSISEESFFLKIKKTLRSFRNFSYFMLLLGATSLLSLMIACLYDNSLPIKIWFPLNWKENNIYFGIAYCYVMLNSLMAVVIMQFTILIWYIMHNCTLKYEVLGHRFRQLGNILSTSENQLKFSTRQDLVRCVQAHQEIELNTEQVRSFFSPLFFGLIPTSGVSICLSVFLLSFGWSGNIFKYISYVPVALYLFFDIFVIMFLGNEMQTTIEKLQYCIFESNWINRSNSYKKDMIFVMTTMNKSHEIVIAKLYPLNLKTFMSVLKGAYSMFNVLQNV